MCQSAIRNKTPHYISKLIQLKTKLVFLLQTWSTKGNQSECHKIIIFKATKTATTIVTHDAKQWALTLHLSTSQQPCRHEPVAVIAILL